MRDRTVSFSLGAVVAAGLAVSVSLYTSARAQGAGPGVGQGPPPAGPRGITGGQQLQQQPLPQRANPGQYAQGGGGGIAADGGYVYVLRGNLLIAITGVANGRMRVVDQIEIPQPNRGNFNAPNPFRRDGQQNGGQSIRPGGQQNGGGIPPPPKK